MSPIPPACAVYVPEFVFLILNIEWALKLIFPRCNLLYREFSILPSSTINAIKEFFDLVCHANPSNKTPIFTVIGLSSHFA
jgi:hypothetical protein